jgi:VCBS repeat protein/FG-GAP repeat protein
VIDSVAFHAGANPTNFGANPTRMLSWMLNDGNPSHNLSVPATTTVTIAPTTKEDFNGDGFADVLWHNNTTGDTGWTDVHNGMAWHGIGASTTYNVVGVGDFNGDGFADVVWHNNTTGDTGWTDVHNGMAWHGIGASTTYNIVGVGDLNGDGFADVVGTTTRPATPAGRTSTTAWPGMA